MSPGWRRPLGSRHRRSQFPRNLLLNPRKSRQGRVLATYQLAGEPLTDRQVRDRLQLREMNEVRPRITELIKMDPPRLREVGKVVDDETGKTVRLVTIANGSRERLLF